MPDYQINQNGDFVHIADRDGNTIVISLFALPRLIHGLLRLVYPDLPLREEHTIAAPDADSSVLAQLGKEWFKPAKRRRQVMNRIYFDPLHGWYGLLIQPDRSPTFRGHPCTEDEARAIIARFAGAKVYFNVVSKMFHGTQIGREDFAFIVEQIRTLERGLPDDPS